MVDYIVCALCFDALTTLPDHTLTQARTKCCLEEICQACCQTLADLTLAPDSSSFTCANCSAQTSLEVTDLKQKGSQAIDSFNETVVKHYDTTKSAIEARLAEIQANLIILNGVNDQLKTNLSDIMTQAAVEEASYLTQITTRFSDYHHLMAKNLEITRSQYKQLEDQVKAGLKYLGRLGSSPPVESTDPNLTPNALNLPSQALYLVELDYDLTLLQRKYLDMAIPAVPHYQPLRLLNHNLVLDDIADQFTALTKRQYRHGVIYYNLIGELEDDFGLTNPYFVALVELASPDQHDHTQPDKLPSKYLSCWSTGASEGFVLVDQDARVVFYRPDHLLAISTNWLVTLVDKSTEMWIQVNSLSDILAQKVGYRLQRFGFTDEVKVASTRICPDRATYTYQTYAQVKDYGQSCEIWLYCDRVGGVEPGGVADTSVRVRFQRWSVINQAGSLTAVLKDQHLLPSDETIVYFKAQTVVLLKGITATRWYGQVGDDGHNISMKLIDKASPIKLLQDGSLISTKVVATNGAGKDWSAKLRRPRGIIELGGVSDVMLTNLSMTSWGRLMKISVGDEDDVDEGYGEGEDEFNIGGRDVVMTFY